VTQVA